MIKKAIQIYVSKKAKQEILDLTKLQKGIQGSSARQEEVASDIILSHVDMVNEIAELKCLLNSLRK